MSLYVMPNGQVACAYVVPWQFPPQSTSPSSTPSQSQPSPVTTPLGIHLPVQAPWHTPTVDINRKLSTQSSVSDISPATSPSSSPKQRKPERHSDTEPLKVSCNTEVTRLAGAVAKRLRSKGEVCVDSMGAGSVARALKALCLDRIFLLQANMTQMVQIESISAPARDNSSYAEGEVRKAEHPGLRFLVQAWKLKQEEPPIQFDVIHRITADSVVKKAAGAIAKLMRVAGLKGQSIGLIPDNTDEALNNTAKAVALARAMLSGNDLDIYCLPRFKKDDTYDHSDQEVQLAMFLVRKKGSDDASSQRRRSSGGSTINSSEMDGGYMYDPMMPDLDDEEMPMLGE